MAPQLLARRLVVTMFTDGSSDILVAFDEASGKELWRHAIDGTEILHAADADIEILDEILGLGARAQARGEEAHQIGAPSTPRPSPDMK